MLLSNGLYFQQETLFKTKEDKELSEVKFVAKNKMRPGSRSPCERSDELGIQQIGDFPRLDTGGDDGVELDVRDDFMKCCVVKEMPGIIRKGGEGTGAV